MHWHNWKVLVKRGLTNTRIGKSWRLHWDNYALFKCPAGLRESIYTSSAIESLNSLIHKATKKCVISPTGGFCQESDLPGHTPIVRTMDYTNNKLEAGLESVLIDFEGRLKGLYLKLVFRQN